jgi:uncharacterized membrane protein YbhN (UPF0104 family)
MKLAARVVFGLALGAIFLWLAVSQVDMEGAAAALEQARAGPMLAAVAIYWFAIGLRTVRWRALLNCSASLTFGQVAQCLIIGYAINNILPARLGELFRVDFVRRQYGVARSAVLGSIIVERLADGLIAISVLVMGLTLLDLTSDHSALVTAAYLTAAGIVGISIGLYFLLFMRHWLPVRLHWLYARLEILTIAITAIRRLQLAQVAVLSLMVWTLEAVAVWLIIWAFGPHLTFGELCLVFGSAALSTLIPSAPGYLGSLQAAFVLAFSALGIATLPGLLSATATQLLLFGSITLVGLTMLFAKHLQGALSSLVRGQAGTGRWLGEGDR